MDAGSGPLTVAVCSPHPVIRTGLETLLCRHPERFRIVTPPRGPDHADPDIVLYDVMALLHGDTAELVYLVEQTHAKVLAVGRDLRPDLVGQALATGADGFFSIGVDEEELVAAVESAGTGWEEGDAGEDPTVGSSESAARSQQLGQDVGLTDRERKVLGLVAQGLTNPEIAARSYLSINSVKTYIRTAYRKIGVTSRGQAVSWAIRHGFDSTPEDPRQD